MRICTATACPNPVPDLIPYCGRHGGETRVVWSVYRQGHGWLTDNDTIVDWEHDVDHARWFDSETTASDALAEMDLEGDGPDDIAIVRIK